MVIFILPMAKRPEPEDKNHQSGQWLRGAIQNDSSFVNKAKEIKEILKRAIPHGSPVPYGKVVSP